MSKTLRISKPFKETNFQFMAEIPVPSYETAKSVTEQVIDYIYAWIESRLDKLMLPERENFSPFC